MFKDILIVLDNQKVCPEALDYGRQFALRMDDRVTLLLLVTATFQGNPLPGSKHDTRNGAESRAAKLLNRYSESFIQHGLEVSSAYRVGEPSQELLRFLADRPPFQAIIWGSSPDLPGKSHWLSRVSANLQYPLLTVRKKEHP
jgi:nucleotide-binding universal stress UspA family protein